MKKSIFLLALLLSAAGVEAQNPTTYFMEGSTLRSQFNPAFAPLRGYVNIPGIGGIDVGVNGNLSLDKVLYPRNGRLVTLIDSSVPAAQALGGLKSDNLLGEDSRVNLIGFGAYTHNRKSFWSFGIDLRAVSQTQLPYSLFEFLKEGKEGRIDGIGASAESFVEAGFTYSFPMLHDKLYLGIRGKFLMGVARSSLNYDRFDVSLQDDCWKVDAQGTFDMTMAGTTVDYSTDADGRQSFKPGDLDYSPKKPSGYGFAVDLGATYDILPQLQASLAVTDLGFICWNSAANISGVSERNLTFQGVEVVDGVAQQQPEFDFDMLKFTRTASQGQTKMLRATVNAGLEYEVWRHKIGLGLLYTAQVRAYRTQHNITGSVNFHPVRWFGLTGSYSVIGNRGGAVGLGLNLCPSWINFFVATDVVTVKHTPQWVPIKQSNLHVTLGLGVPIGKRGQRCAAIEEREYHRALTRAAKERR